MRILFHGWEFPPVGGGVGVYMYNMACALRRCGHEPVVVTGRQQGVPDGAVVTEAGVVYRIYDRSQAGSPAVINEVARIAKDHKVDVIEGSDHMGECAGLLRRSRVAPVLIKLHACYALRSLRKAHIRYAWQAPLIAISRLRAFRQSRNEMFVIRHADLLMAPTRAIADALRREGVLSNLDVGYVPNPANIIKDTGDYKQAPSPVMLFVGRIEILKGIQYLPNILKSAAEKVPDVTLEIAGDDSFARGIGSMKTWLKKELGPLVNRVRFLGRIEGGELSAAYSRAWVVLVPSRWENFPNVVLEAMVHSRPAVGTPFGGMPEMLEGTGAPTLPPDSCDYCNAVTELLLDGNKRRSIAELMRARVEAIYSPESVVQSYVKYLEERL